MSVARQTRIRLILAGVVLVCGVALMGLVYIVLNKPEVYVNPGIVSKSAPVGSVHVHPSSALHRTTLLNHVKPYTPPGRSSRMRSAPMPAMHVWTTSSAKVHEAAGGSTGMVLYTFSHGASQRGVSATGLGTTFPMGSFVALASSRQMAQPEAAEAPLMAQLTPRHAPGPPDLGGDQPPGEHQLTEQPVGDGLWVLLALVLCYACLRIRSSHIKQLSKTFKQPSNHDQTKQIQT